MSHLHEGEVEPRPGPPPLALARLALLLLLLRPLPLCTRVNSHTALAPRTTRPALLLPRVRLSGPPGPPTAARPGEARHLPAAAAAAAAGPTAGGLGIGIGVGWVGRGGDARVDHGPPDGEGVAQTLPREG
jgi:hypothetical protein